MRVSEIVVIGLAIGALILCLSLVRAYNRYRTKVGPLSERETDSVAWMTALGLVLIVGLTVTVIGIIANTWR
jgi:cytochrome b561